MGLPTLPETSSYGLQPDDLEFLTPGDSGVPGLQAWKLCLLVFGCGWLVSSREILSKLPQKSLLAQLLQIAGLARIRQIPSSFAFARRRGHPSTDFEAP